MMRTESVKAKGLWPASRLELAYDALISNYGYSPCVRRTSNLAMTGCVRGGIVKPGAAQNEISAQRRCITLSISIEPAATDFKKGPYLQLLVDHLRARRHARFAASLCVSFPDPRAAYAG
jgi:hypothetical protein